MPGGNMAAPSTTITGPNSGVQTSGDQAATTQNPENTTGALTPQQQEANRYASYIQAILRAIQLRSYTEATTQQKKTGDTSKDLKSYKVDFTSGQPKELLDKMFKYSYVGPLIGSSTGPFAYGYAKRYMETDKASESQAVVLSEILLSYVVFFRKENWGNENPSQLSNYPVYIPLSFFHLILNAVGLLYRIGSDPSGAVAEEPVVYLDFNNNTTLCLTNPQSFSLDPINFLVRYEVEDGCYQDLFLNVPVKEPFKKSEDVITTGFPPFRANNAYQGKLLNVLVNIDYLLNKVSTLAENNNANSAEFQTTLQSIYDDLSKALGNINFFRVAYSDVGNVAYISDDQMIPGVPGVLQQGSDRYVLPNIGKKSIYHSLSMKTDTSTKIGDLLAISANSERSKMATAGSDASPLAVTRVEGKDRYKSDVLAAGERTKEKSGVSSQQEIAQATSFNSFVRTVYGKTVTVSEKDAVPSMQFYQHAMNVLKCGNKTTEGITMLPISVNFITDGIAGFTKLMGFKLPEGIVPKVLDRVGYIVTGEEQIIESNRWTTNIRANMCFLREANAAVAGCSKSSSPTTTTAGGTTPRLLGPTPGGTGATSPTVAPVQSGTQFVQGLPGLNSVGTNTPSSPASSTSNGGSGNLGVNSYGESANSYVNNIMNNKSDGSSLASQGIDPYKTSYSQLTDAQKQQFRLAMQKQEGGKPGDLNMRNNNPGNITLTGPQNARLWESRLGLPAGSVGTYYNPRSGLTFAVFPSIDSGYKAIDYTLTQRPIYANKPIAYQISTWLGATK